MHLSEHSTINMRSGDDAMVRRLFVELSIAEQDAFITSLQARRLVSVSKYKELVTTKQSAKDERTAATLDKESAMMEKELLALDKALEKVEKRLIRINALQAIIKVENDGN